MHSSLGTIKHVETGMLMWPATLIGNYIGRRCCGCWFEQVTEETISLLMRVSFRTTIITHFTQKFLFSPAFYISLLIINSFFKVQGLTNETSSSFQMTIDNKTDDDIIEDNADALQHLLYWPAMISPILAFSFMW
jgi:hypothetical protein